MRDVRVAVLLDIDDTILDFQSAEAAALRRTFGAMGICADDGLIARYSDINRSQWELLEEGVLTRDQVLVRRFELLFEEYGIPHSGAEATERYENELCRGHWFMPGAQELLRTLSGACRLFLVSNGSEKVQEARLASAGIAGFFEQIFISEVLGAEKPTREFFDRCFAAIPDFDPARAILVGDSLSSDIRGAKNAGLLSCWYNHRRRPGRPDISPDFEIRELSELPPLLARLFPNSMETEGEMR